MSRPACKPGDAGELYAPQTPASLAVLLWRKQGVLSAHTSFKPEFLVLSQRCYNSPLLADRSGLLGLPPGIATFEREAEVLRADHVRCHRRIREEMSVRERCSQC